MLPAVLIAGAIVLLALSYSNFFAQADVTTQQYGIPGDFKTYQFFATSTAQIAYGTTTNATSTAITTWFNGAGVMDRGYFVVAGAKKVTFYFQRDAGTGPNEGSTRYRVQVARTVSPTESDWFYYNKLVQNLATSTEITTLAIETIGPAATSTVIDSMQLENDGFYAVRCIVIETTDGEHECAASATW